MHCCFNIEFNSHCLFTLKIFSSLPYATFDVQINTDSSNSWISMVNQSINQSQNDERWVNYKSCVCVCVCVSDGETISTMFFFYFIFGRIVNPNQQFAYSGHTWEHPFVSYLFCKKLPINSCNESLCILYDSLFKHTKTKYTHPSLQWLLPFSSFLK